jgi:transposase
MEVLFPSCAGIDVHQKSVVACRIYTGADGKTHTDTRTFRTMTRDLLLLGDWLAEVSIDAVAMESTGDYWKSVYNVLEPNFVVWVVNAQHVKNVPGRKTDVKDAHWLADLMRHGLVSPSFIPAPEQREWRDLTRMRLNLVRERACLANRLHKALESANIKLGAVASDILGVSSRRMLDALAASQDYNPVALADLALGALAHKREDLALALEGRMNEHHRFMISQLLKQVRQLDEHIGVFEARIALFSVPFEQAVQLVDSIPAMSLTAAQALVSEIGTDMTRFATAGHLASWLGLCPGNNQSGGKRLPSRTRKGNRYARAVLVQAAHVASRLKDTQFYALYRRLAARRGKKRALIGVAHALVVIVHTLISRAEPYQEIGPDYLVQRHPEREFNDLQRRAARLGLQLVPAATA